MKATGRIRTLRGSILFPARSSTDPENTGRRNLILDDGRINVGYKIISFHIWNSDMCGTLNSFASQAHLSMGLEITSALPDAADNREIGWAKWQTSQEVWSLVDPDHIVVRDLNLIFPLVNNISENRVNYYIMMEEYDISDQEAIISIIKEESQDVDN